MFDSMKIPNTDDIASPSLFLSLLSCLCDNEIRNAEQVLRGDRRRGGGGGRARALDIDYGVACEILRRAESSRKLHSFQELLLRRVAISGVLNSTAERGRERDRKKERKRMCVCESERDSDSFDSSRLQTSTS